MNREIKFRAWDESQKYMAYQGTPDLETIQSFIHHFGDKVLMQFTGLIDKNGKEVYEGDIIKGKTFSGKENISYVIYDNNYGCWQLQTVGNKPLSFPIKSFNKELEIIGNIYENSDLLKYPKK